MAWNIWSFKNIIRDAFRMKYFQGNGLVFFTWNFGLERPVIPLFFTFLLFFFNLLLETWILVHSLGAGFLLTIMHSEWVAQNPQKLRMDPSTFVSKLSFIALICIKIQNGLPWWIMKFGWRHHSTLWNSLCNSVFQSGSIMIHNVLSLELCNWLSVHQPELWNYEIHNS